MSGDRKEIDLIIRAAIQGGKSLESVAKSISDIEKAIESQTDAMKRGESTYDELKASLESLKRAQRDLEGIATLGKRYTQFGDQVATSAAKVAEATQKYNELSEKIAATGKSTKTQETQLVRYARAVDSGNKSIALATADQARYGEALQAAGLDLTNLSASMSGLDQRTALVGAAILRTEGQMGRYADTVRKAREENRRFAEEQDFLSKQKANLDAFRGAEYTKLFTPVLDAADTVDQQKKITDALRKAADEAVAAARGYKTLGTAMKSVSGDKSALRNTIQGIIDPAAQARTTLAGVEGEVQKLGAAIKGVKGPISDYKGQVAQLVAVQKTLSQQAGMVDAYQRQVASLRAARAEYSQARAQVLQFANELRNSTGANDQLQASLRQAQAALASAQGNLSRQVATTRELRDSMRQAGLSTQDLAGTQSRLASAAQSSTRSMQALADAKRRYGEATRDVGGSLDIFNNGGRTTLSLLQRIRGEVLSLVAAYAGLYGVIGGASSAIEAFNTKRAIQNQLALSVGNDDAKIAEEYQYIREQADRLGVSFEAAARGYAKFSASAKIAGRSTQEIRYIFETFSEVGRVANLTQDDLDGVYKALEQIVSKGKIQAEELRGQLGDRLFGAFQVAAQALKDQFPELDKAMKNGQVTSEQLVKIAEKYKEIVGERLPEATQALAADQARLNSALFDFKLLVAEQGFADEFGKLVETLTTFFQSEDGKEFAKGLSDALGFVVSTMRALIENSETVKTVLRDILVIWGLWKATQIGVWLVGLRARVIEATIAFNGMGKAAQTILRWFAVLSAAAAGWEIGTILSQKFAVVRQAGVALVIGFEKTWTAIKYGAQIIWSEIPAFFADGFSALGNVATSNLRKLIRLFANAAKAVGAVDIGASAEAAITSLTFKTDRLGNASKALRAELEAELKRIDDLGYQMFVDAAKAPGSSKVGKAAARATSKPDASGGGGATDTSEEEQKAAAKRVQIREQLEAELRTIEAKIERNEKDSLERRLKAIDITYQTLLGKIRKLGGVEGAALEKRLTAAVGELKLQETKKFNDELITEQERLGKALEQIDARIGRKSLTALPARLKAIEDQYADHYRKLADLEELAFSNGNDAVALESAQMRAKLDAQIAALQNLERQKVYEEQINAIYDARQGKLDQIVAQVASGALTPQAGNAQIDFVNEQTIATVESLILKMKELKTTVADPELQEALQLGIDTAMGKLDKFRQETVTGLQGAMQGLRTSLMQMDRDFAKVAVNAGVDALTNLFTDLVSGTKSAGEALRDFVLGFVRSMAQIAARALATYLVLQMLDAIYPGLGKATAAMMGAGARQYHSGGVVGAGGGTTRQVDPNWFINAPRFHGGGIPGLAADEYPAILKKNEEVLTQNDPRNVLNGGGAGGQSPVNMKIINMIDSGSVVSEGLSTQSGTRAFLNFISANRSDVKSILGAT